MTGRRVVEVIRRGRVGSDGQSNLIDVVTTAIDATVLNEDSGKAYRCTDALTLTLPPATSPGWSLIVDADGGDVTLSAAMTVNGVASLVVPSGNSCLVYSDGSQMFARFYFANELSAAVLLDIIAGNPVSFSGSLSVPGLTVNGSTATPKGLELLAAAGGSDIRTAAALGSVATRNFTDADDLTVQPEHVAKRGNVKNYMDSHVPLLGGDFQDVTAQRGLASNFINNTDKPIWVLVTVFQTGSAATIVAKVDANVTPVTIRMRSSASSTFTTFLLFPVPVNQSYRVEDLAGGSQAWTLTHWMEI